MGEGIKDKCYELMEYANIANDSYGNYCFMLGSIESDISFMESGFRKAWEKEVESNLDNFKNNSTIEVETETRTHEKKWLNWHEKE